MKFLSAGKTDKGVARQLNEDSMLMSPEEGLFAVCDGLGGHSAGEVARALAVAVIRDAVTGKDDVDEPLRKNVSPEAQRLAAAIRSAGNRIYEAALSSIEHKGMGTTATAALFHDGFVSVAHVGDSRAYRLRRGNMKQLSFDHSLVAEQVRDGILTAEAAKTSPYRNVITRALGTSPQVEVDVYEYDVRPGDRVLLCSDGLHGVISDDELKDVLTSFDDPEAGCDELIREANERGGPDNITVVLIYVLDGQQ